MSDGCGVWPSSPDARRAHGRANKRKKATASGDWGKEEEEEEEEEDGESEGDVFKTINLDLDLSAGANDPDENEDDVVVVTVGSSEGEDDEDGDAVVYNGHSSCSQSRAVVKKRRVIVESDPEDEGAEEDGHARSSRIVLDAEDDVVLVTETPAKKARQLLGGVSPAPEFELPVGNGALDAGNSNKDREAGRAKAKEKKPKKSSMRKASSILNFWSASPAAPSTSASTSTAAASVSPSSYSSSLAAPRSHKLKDRLRLGSGSGSTSGLKRKCISDLGPRLVGGVSSSSASSSSASSSASSSSSSSSAASSAFQVAKQHLSHSQPTPASSSSASSSASALSSSSSLKQGRPAQAASIFVEDEPWCTKYAPETEDDLCLHARKIADVKNWMLRTMEELSKPAADVSRRPATQNMLILSGPPGCGKSALVTALARTLGLHVQTWHDEVDHGMQYGLGLLGAGTGTTKMGRFRDFLLRARKYNSLLCGPRSRGGDADKGARKLLLIDEIPYIGKPEYHSQFNEIMLSTLKSSKHLIVFMLTDATERSSEMEVSKLFSNAVLNSGKVHAISCNPVNNGAMKKALQRIIAAEGVDISSHALTALVDSSKGDLRSAINALQFGTVDGDKTAATEGSVPKMTWNGNQKGNQKKTKKKKQVKKTEAEKEAEKAKWSTGRDTSYSVFHAVNRILVGKTDVEPELVVEKANVTPARFTEYLHENYMKHVPGDDDMDNLWQAVEGFTASDLLSRGALQRFGDSQGALPEHVASSVSVRSLQIAWQNAAAASSAASSSSFASSASSSSSKRAGFTPANSPSGYGVMLARQKLVANVRRAFVAPEQEPMSASCLSSDFFVDILPYMARMRGSTCSDAQSAVLQQLCAYSQPLESRAVRSIVDIYPAPGCPRNQIAHAHPHPHPHPHPHQGAAGVGGHVDAGAGDDEFDIDES